MVLERILVLIRNVLQVPADPDAERRPDNDASVHDQVSEFVSCATISAKAFTNVCWGF